MSVDQEEPILTLREVSELLFRRILTRTALEEAARSDHLDVELTLMRAWLHDSIEAERFKEDLVRKLLSDLAKATAVRYRLSPRRANELEASLTRTFDHLREQMMMAAEDL